jgi:hypothetical protein
MKILQYCNLGNYFVLVYCEQVNPIISTTQFCD